jgi:tetratricopeptide (TPR) repeat protein
VLIAHAGIISDVRPGRYGTGMGDLLYLQLGPRRGFRRATTALTWYERGCALEPSDPEGAMAAYRRAIAGRRDLADAHNNLGRLHHDRGELALAEQCYRRAIAADPMVALYAFNLGVVLEDLGCPYEAISAYELALALEPALADAHFNLARQIELAARASGDELMLRRAVRHLQQYRQLARVTG